MRVFFLGKLCEALAGKGSTLSIPYAGPRRHKRKMLVIAYPQWSVIGCSVTTAVTLAQSVKGEMLSSGIS